MAQSILVIDDDSGVCRAIARILRAEGDLDVTVTSTGKEGLLAVASRKFDLVLLDLVLPDLRGFEVLELMGGDRPPVIAMSGIGGAANRAVAIAHGCHGFIDKPFSLEALIAEVRRVLAQTSGG